VIEVVERHKVKITVLRRFNPSDVFKKSPVTHSGSFEACGTYRDGQEFTVDKDGKMPEGFCTSAWVSIYSSVRLLSFGGDFP